VRAWFAERGWGAFRFQEEAWAAYLRGQSGLIHAPTGLGKTMAAWLGPVIEAMDEAPVVGDEVVGAEAGAGSKVKRARRAATEPLRVIWISPLRALASDTQASLEAPVRALGLEWSIEKRTGDTSASVKLKQKERLPTALVTTPESLSLLLSYPDSREKFKTLRAVIVDEWHELMGSKRGVQTELALARLRAWMPGLRTWGVSATLGNLEEARDVLVGPAVGGATQFAALIRGDQAKELSITTIIPKDPERFPWAGHMGLRVAKEVIESIANAPTVANDGRAFSTSLLFTNTRSQAEIWFRRLMELKGEWIGEVAIHHGSLDRKVRDKIEQLLDEGKLRCVVCTSSLDLGVDFQPVDQVYQLGSPKGVARLVQRAGRSGHRPGAVSSVIGVPTHSFELVEFAAAREAAMAGRIESRAPLELSLDVLAQHVVTCACGGGFVDGELLAEVRTTHAFRNLSDEQWMWVMDFVCRGGQALNAYAEYARIGQREDGVWVPVSERIARSHRMGIGTITGEISMNVQYLSGRRLGTIEEGFVARLTPGARFVFAGRVLELIRVRGMTAYVRPAKRKSATVPKWNGGRFPLSSQLALAVREKLNEARQGIFAGPEMIAASSLLRLQGLWSRIPAMDEVLVEHIEISGPEGGGDGSSAIIYPFEGRLVHEGLGALAAYRLSRERALTVVVNVSDYGFALNSSQPLALDDEAWRRLLSQDRLLEDLLACLNTTELARRQFRDIARVAGLIVPGYPGQRKPGRQLQASSEMFFDVFTEFDPHNLLLDQARREVLEAQLEIGRLSGALERICKQRMLVVPLDRLTPLAFPIWAEHLRSIHLSSEKWSQVVERMVMRLETVANEGARRSPAVITRATPPLARPRRKRTSRRK